MKLLIAYDGSECSDAAIVDLKRAGLPANAEAIILSVAEMSPQYAAVSYGVMLGGAGMFVPECMESELSSTHRLDEANEAAAKAAERLHADFPNWHIDTEAWVDSAAAAIIRKAHGWNPDLIIVGSHGRSGVRRFVHGSVSEHVLNHVTTSVRISRHRLHSQERAIRILVGVDGSVGSKRAVYAMAARDWPPGTEARVVGIVDTRVALAAALSPKAVIPADIEDEGRRRLSEAVHAARQLLGKSGLLASHQILGGKPSDTLLLESEIWGADCIFVGATGLHGLQRLLLGGTSTSVATRAHCSVEIVRA